MIIGVRDKITKDLIGYITTTDIVPPQGLLQEFTQRLVKASKEPAVQYTLTRNIDEAEQFPENTFCPCRRRFDTDTTETFVV